VKKWRRVVGLVMIALGGSSAAWGVRHFREPGMDLGPHATYRYAMSRQWGSITWGVGLILLGVIVYRMDRRD
jgi:hypothetical protein